MVSVFIVCSKTRQAEPETFTFECKFTTKNLPDIRINFLPLNWTGLISLSHISMSTKLKRLLTLSQTTTKLKEVAEDDFKFDENGRKFSKRVENTVRKGEIACLNNFPFSQGFQKDLHCRHVKNRTRLNPLPNDKILD